MRIIPNEGFWENVRARYGATKYREILKLFYGDTDARTVAGMRSRLAAQLPAMIEALRINECLNESAFRLYHGQLMDIWQDVYGRESVLSAPQIPSALGEQFKRRVAVLGQRFAREMLCHPTYTGYVCYCEPNKRASRGAPQEPIRELEHV